MGTYTATPKDWVDGTTPTAVDFDDHLKALALAFGACSTYTPTLTATTTNPTMGSGAARVGRGRHG